MAFPFFDFWLSESLSSTLLLSLLSSLLLPNPSELSLCSFPSEFLPGFLPSEPLSSDSLELLSRFFFSEPLSPDSSELLPRFFLFRAGRAIVTGAAAARHASWAGRGKASITAITRHIFQADRAALTGPTASRHPHWAGRAAPGDAAALRHPRRAGLVRPALPCTNQHLPPRIAAFPFSIIPHWRVTGGPAQGGCHGAWRQSPPPDGPAAARPPAPRSGLLPAAGEPFDFGVKVFGPLVVFPFFIMFSSVSP